MCPDYNIGLNETRLGLAPPIFLCSSMQNIISNREAEKALTLGTLYSTEDAFKVSYKQVFFCIFFIANELLAF